MKNVFKFKYLPVFAFLLAGGLAFAENTLKPVVAASFYRDPSDGQWKSLEGLQPGTEAGQYECLPPTQDEQCTAETLSAEGVPGGTITDGTFHVIE